MVQTDGPISLLPYQLEYWHYVQKHRKAVMDAGVEIVGNIPIKRLLVHDASKLESVEFFPYAMKYYGPLERRQSPHVGVGYNTAWLHHVHNNDHHWQHWVLPTPPRNTVIEIPVVAVREMVADWLSFGDVDEMVDFLERKLPSMELHPKTKAKLHYILDEIGAASQTITNILV